MSSVASSHETVAMLRLGPVELSATHLTSFEALSHLFELDIRCTVDHAMLDLDELAGAAAAVILRAAPHERTVTGLLASVSVARHETGSSVLSARLVPRAHLLRLARHNRSFKDRDPLGIIVEILNEARVKHRVACREPHETRRYFAQRDETDWDFVERLCEEEGVVFYFADGDGETELVLCDAASTAPDLEGGSALPYDPDVTDARFDRVLEMGVLGRAVAARYRRRAFDPRSPFAPRDAATGEGSEDYDAPGGGPRAVSALERRVKLAREASEGERRRFAARLTGIRACPGHAVEVTGHPLSADERFVLCEVRQVFDLATRRHVCNATMMHEEVPRRPRPPRDAPAHPGLGVARVGSEGDVEVHTDAAGRVEVELDWDMEDGSRAAWSRVAQPYTDDSLVVPRVGWLTFALHEEGNAETPVLEGRLHDGEHPPSYGLPATQTRWTLKTATLAGEGFNEIHFEDQSGGQDVFFGASKDMRVEVLATSTSSVARNRSVTVGTEKSTVIGQGWNERVEGSQAVTVGADESRQVGAGRNRQAGSEAIVIGAERSIQAASMSSLTQVERSLVVTGDVSETCARGDGSRAAEAEISSGGSGFFDAGAGISWSAALARTVVVQGNLTAAAKDSATLVVGGDRTLAAGADLVRVAKDRFGEQADGQLSLKVAGPTVASAEDIILEAYESIVIVCGSSSLVLSTEGIEIRSTDIALPSAQNLQVKALETRKN